MAQPPAQGQGQGLAPPAQGQGQGQGQGPPSPLIGRASSAASTDKRLADPDDDKQLRRWIYASPAIIEYAELSNYETKKQELTPFQLQCIRLKVSIQHGIAGFDLEVLHAIAGEIKAIYQACGWKSHNLLTDKIKEAKWSYECQWAEEPAAVLPPKVVVIYLPIDMG